MRDCYKRSRVRLSSKKGVNMSRRILRGSTAIGAGLGVLLSGGLAVADDDSTQTATPIKHLIILIGENRSFDNIYATYQPKQGQTVANLLSRGIVNSSGELGANGARSQQFQINQPYPSTYFIDALATAGKTLYQQAPGTPSFPATNTAYVPTAPGGLDQGQAPFAATLVPDWQLPSLEPSLEKQDLGPPRTGDCGLAM